MCQNVFNEFYKLLSNVIANIQISGATQHKIQYPVKELTECYVQYIACYEKKGDG